MTSLKMKKKKTHWSLRVKVSVGHKCTPKIENQVKKKSDFNAAINKMQLFCINNTSIRKNTRLHLFQVLSGCVVFHKNDSEIAGWILRN